MGSGLPKRPRRRRLFWQFYMRLWCGWSRKAQILVVFPILHRRQDNIRHSFKKPCWMLFERHGFESWNSAWTIHNTKTSSLKDSTRDGFRYCSCWERDELHICKKTRYVQLANLLSYDAEGSSSLHYQILHITLYTIRTHVHNFVCNNVLKTT